MKLLAFDTSTEVMSIAVSRDDGAAAGLWQQQGAGGAQASTGLIAGVLELMRQSGMALAELDAICFGCGPGSFTGLRTACAVAQGLAFGAGVPVLPVNSLLAVAEEGRHMALSGWHQGEVTALLDARMDEMYAARFAFAAGHWRELQAAHLLRPQDLVLPASAPADTHHGAADGTAEAAPPLAAAGNVFTVYGERLSGLAPAIARIPALPLATALLRLAPQLLAAGAAVPAEQALPLYVRDKVAQTTAERAATKAAQVAAQTASHAAAQATASPPTP